MSPLDDRSSVLGAALLTLLLCGCTSITGLDGTSSYACKAPEGVRCDSVSGTYHNALQNNLPSQRRSPTSATPSSPSGGKAAPAMLSTAARSASTEISSYAAAPLRESPRVLRLWIKSWEDADRDLNGESHVYVQVDGGRWLIDHVQRQSREGFAPVRPGKSAAAARNPMVEPSKPGANSTTGAASDDASAIGQALRALQNRSTPRADN